MNLKEIYKNMKSFWLITIILCIFNLPVTIFSIINRYSIFRIKFVIAIIVLTQLFLTTLINRMIFIKQFKVIDDAKRIIISDFRDKTTIGVYIVYLILYYIFLYSIMSNSEFIIKFPFIASLNIINFMNVFNMQNTFFLFKGKNYVLYGENLIKNEEILYYDIKTIKKYKSDKKDKIKLTLHIKGRKDIEVIDSKIAYKIKDVIDEIEEERYIEEKMKQYGLLEQ